MAARAHSTQRSAKRARGVAGVQSHDGQSAQQENHAALVRPVHRQGHIHDFAPGSEGDVVRARTVFHRPRWFERALPKQHTAQEKKLLLLFTPPTPTFAQVFEKKSRAPAPQ
jgi:hypothetical protein